MLHHRRQRLLAIASLADGLDGHASLAEHARQNFADRSGIVYNQDVGIHEPPYKAIHRLRTGFSLERRAEKPRRPEKSG
jgi:hypothetical protein